MEIDPDKVVTQEETGEPAAIDAIEGRVQEKMRRIEENAHERVVEGMPEADERGSDTK